MKRSLLFVTLSAVTFTALNAQFINGSFEDLSSVRCLSVAAWQTSPDEPQYVLNGEFGPTAWVDITGCASGNGKWIQQTINTVPGKSYYIKFKLGTWANSGFDAGVHVSIDGTALGGRYASSVFGAPGLPCWSGVITCAFTAKSNKTLVRFTGDGRLLSDPFDMSASPEVMGIDDISLEEAFRKIPDTTICKGDSVLLNTRIPSGTVFWNTGVSAPFILVKKAGTYSYMATQSACPGSFRDTIVVKIADKFKVFLGNDTAFCHAFSHKLHAGQGAKEYLWNTGETTMEITVDTAGLYAVRVIDPNSCPEGDTINIEAIPMPQLSFRYDSAGCRYVYLSVDNPRPGLSYLWSTGDTTLNIAVEKTGIYTLTASHPFCSNKDSVEIKDPPMPVADIGPDTVLCGDLYLYAGTENLKYRWSTGAKTYSINVKDTGAYTVTVSRDKCEASDTIQVHRCEDMVWHVPNAFSPDGNAVNPVFRVYGKNLRDVSLQIYNRWGEKLHEDQGLNASWAGNSGDRICEEGIYLYVIEVSGYENGVFRRKHERGMLSLFR